MARKLLYHELDEHELTDSARIILSAFNAMEEATGVPKTPSAEAVEERLKEYLADTGIPCHLYGGFVDGRQIGFFMIRKLGIDEETWEICMLSVLPEEQGNGYGRALLRDAIQKILDYKGVLAVCAVTENNETALNLFADQGFACEASGIPVGENLSIWMLRKDLKNAAAACAARQEYPEEFEEETCSGCASCGNGCNA